MANEKLQNYEINIYRLKSDISLEEYREKFPSLNKNFIHQGTFKQNNASGFYLTYINITENNEIAWFKKWTTFFPEINSALRKDSQTGHGLIIIKIDDDNVYGIIFGRAFILIKDFIVHQFGMDMAAILIDGKSIDSVSSKFFSLNKNKSITSYYGDSTFDFSENEAVDLLKADIVNPNGSNEEIKDLLNLCQSKATIGMDNLKLTIHKKTIELTDIIKCCSLISKIRLQPENFPFPRMTLVKGDLRDKLDSELLTYILAENNRINFSVPFFSKDISDEYVFLNNINDIQIKVSNIKSETYSNIDYYLVKQFLIKNKDKIKSIREIKIIVDGEVYDFVKWIDEQIETNGISYAIVNGKWYQFNEAYISNINKRVELIEKEGIIEIDNGKFASSKKEMDEFYKNNQVEIQTAYGSDKPAYKEYVYNYKLKKKYNYALFDRIIYTGNIEVCDLYANECLIHCKIGDSSKLEECIRQSIYGTRYYYQNIFEVKLKENADGVKINNVNTAEVIYLRENGEIENFLISRSKSLRLKQTFIDWVSMCHQIKIKPKLIISKYSS